jgi:hypothetical protein
MRDVVQYFDWLAKVIERSVTVPAELELDQLDHKRGTIDGTIYFADGSRLEFTERVRIENGRPVKRDYRYQYVQNRAAIFRYDNAPHHPQLPGFPHHKHIGRKTIAATEPTLPEILQEVEELRRELLHQASTTTTRKSRQKSKAGNKQAR